LGNRQHPEVKSLIANACARIRAKGKAPGILTADPDETPEYLRLGFEFIAVGSDAGILTKGVRKLAANLNHQIPRLQSETSRIEMRLETALDDKTIGGSDAQTSGHYRTPAVRWAIVVLLSLGMVIAYASRSNISVALAIPDFIKAFGLSDRDRGTVNSAFFW